MCEYKIVDSQWGLLCQVSYNNVIFNKDEYVAEIFNFSIYHTSE